MSRQGNALTLPLKPVQAYTARRRFYILHELNKKEKAMRFGSRRTILSATGILIGSLVTTGLMTGQAAQEPKPQMAEEVFKNVTVLKGIPVDEFMSTMGM